MSHRASDGYITANTTASGTGATYTIRAQSATGVTSTGGKLVLSSGSGTSVDGYITLQSGGVNKLNFYSTASLTALEFENGVLNPEFRQVANTTSSATATDFTIQAQSATGTTSNGGSLKLRSGTGTSTDGYVSVFGGNAEIHRFFAGKDIYLGGQRVKLTSVSSTPYTVLDTDMNLMVDTTAARTINLPATPTAGDAYRIKDSTGTASANNITVQGNGNNIEGVASQTISADFGRLFVVYNGTQWVIF